MRSLLSPRAGAKRTAIVLVAAIAAASLTPLAGAAEPYRKPSDQIVQILETPPTPFVTVDPTGRFIVLLEREAMPPVAELAKPMLRLAGFRVDPETNGRHGVRTVVGLSIKRISDGRETPVQLPPDVSVGFPDFSPDGSRFAFTVTRDRGIELWVCDVESGRARPVVGPRLNGIIGSGYEWMPDGQTIIANLVPRTRGSAPVEPRVPEGPVIQESDGEEAPVRTYQDLLENPQDEALFTYYFTGQPALVDVSSGSIRSIGAPGVYFGFDPAPDGEHLLVAMVHQPYSYLVPAYSFPMNVQVWNTRGEVVADLVDMPLRDKTPIGGVQTGPRSHRWVPTADATLMWVEALDGGDPKRKIAQRDAIFALEAPFDSSPVEVARLEDRYRGAQFLADSPLALVSEYDRDERWTRTWLVNTSQIGSPPRLLFERNIQDRYADPGNPMTKQDARGQRVVHVHNGSIFLDGRGATPEGDRPFLDRFTLSTGATERLWRSAGESYEAVSELLADDGSVVLTRSETPDTPPNYFERNLRTGQRRALTDFADPAPIFRKVHKELVTYEREDGVTLSATLYLPPNHKPGQKHPLFVWAYPFEYNDARTAGQVSGSPYRFTTVGGASHLFLLLEGYAILDRAAMPVIGSDPETVNDTFIEQIVANAQAAIDFAVEKGVADRERVAVGGHSYGAFMTGNLLAHCDLFKAGIARSGAYNRTLTPFGFQSERRPFWEAPEVYFNLSPFMHAHKINEPMLMIHGQNDNNSGTFPVQSERMYHAVKGNGGVARLVMLPYESHGYRGGESVLHTIAEMVDWLDKHVKGARSRAAATN